MTELSPTLSVIIPTYNRKASLRRTLESLVVQTFPLDQIEVIVVDDGSTDDTWTIAQLPLPFTLRYIRQDNQGATAARNHGATVSSAEILIFIDDDVTISPNALESLAEACAQTPEVLVMGTLIRCNGESPSVYASIMLAHLAHAQAPQDLVEVHFRDCNTELLSCKRSDFFALGMLQDPTMGHGWPNWDDVDFAYRAHLKGFRILQSARAIGEHWDYAITDRLIACERWYRASRSAVWLFKRHKGLEGQIPMLYDKTPLTWGHDSPRLMLRKLGRRLLSSGPVLGIGQRIVSLLEHRYPSPAVLGRLYFWLHGAYMFQGYRQGLREFKLVGVEK